MVTLKSVTKVFDTLSPICFNSGLLKSVYSLWCGRLVMCLYGDLKRAVFKATLKSENIVFGNLSLCGVNSYIKVCMKIIVPHTVQVTLNSLYLKCYGYLKIRKYSF